MQEMRVYVSVLTCTSICLVFQETRNTCFTECLRAENILIYYDKTTERKMLKSLEKLKTVQLYIVETVYHFKRSTPKNPVCVHVRMIER